MNPSQFPIRRLLTAEDLADPEIRQLLQAAAKAPSEFVRHRVRLCLLQALIQRQVRPFATDTASAPRSHTLKFGHREDGNLVHLSENTLTKHLLTVGQSGAGKTSFFYTLVSQLYVPF